MEIGPPIEAAGASPSGPQVRTVDTTVASVGPYSWYSRTPGSRARSSVTIPAGMDSPPSTIRRKLEQLSSPGCSRKACIGAGVTTRVLTSRRRMTSTR